MLNNQDMGDSGGEVVSLGTILILEDEVLVSILIEDLMRDMGASEVIVLADAAQALEQVIRLPPDLAILDIHVGADTSFAVADALDTRNIPFMFSSALAGVDVQPRHSHRPMLSKPFSDEELRAHVLGLVRR